MAPPAEGDQRGGAIGGGAVVDDERGRSAADAAVAGQDLFAPSGEAGPRAAAAVVAAVAQPAAEEFGLAAGAAERELGGGSHGGRLFSLR